MTAVWWAVGILLFVVGLLFSIWFHELGHYLTAKKFGMRVTQFMVGIGPTLWSRKKGETEFGIKWIPLAGYARITGMVPPARPGRERKTGRLTQMIEEVRGASLQEIQPGEEKRAFYSKPWWQRVIVMIAGPLQNLVLAFVIFTALLCGLGIPTPSLTVEAVNECVLPATSTVRDCTTPVDESGEPCESPGAAGCALPPRSPAHAAGFEPGDRIEAIDGDPVSEWSQVQNIIRDSPERELSVEIVRGGEPRTLTVTPMSTTLQALDDPDQTVQGGFLGLAPTQPMTRQPLSAVPGQVGNFVVETAERLAGIPERLPQLFEAAFLGAERDPEGPIGVVGVGRISGEIFALPEPPEQKIAFFLSILASLNMVLFLFNLLPIFPLDGGHIAGAVYEGVRNAIYRVRGKPSPGPFDVARLMPVAYVVASFVVVLSGTLLVADIFNPITLTPQ